MVRLRLGLHLGPFVITSDSRPRPRVHWGPRDWGFAVLLALAPVAGLALGRWLS